MPFGVSKVLHASSILLTKVGVIISAFAKGKGPNNERLWLGLKAWVGASQANERVRKRKINEALIESKPYNDFAEIRKSLKNEVLKLAADISVKKLYVEGDILINKISISGSGTLTAKRIITVKITAPDQSIANLNQIKAEKDGVIVSIAVAPGQNVMQDDTLLMMA